MVEVICPFNNQECPVFCSYWELFYLQQARLKERLSNPLLNENFRTSQMQLLLNSQRLHAHTVSTTGRPNLAPDSLTACRNQDSEIEQA